MFHFLFHFCFETEKRFFACTGFFIEWTESPIILTSASLVRNSGDENKIVENLRVGSAHCSVIRVLRRSCFSLITILFAD